MKTVFIILHSAMYVCVCLAVSDKEVRAAIEDGACTRHDVTRACGAGGDCGACHNMIENMIEDHVDEAAASGQKLIPDAALVRRVA